VHTLAIAEGRKQKKDVNTMKLRKRMTALAAALAFAAFAAMPTFAVEADYGAAAAKDAQNYTMAEMLTWAIQDEYLARAEYAQIMDIFAVDRPFSNIAKAEETHISLLTPLFETYGVALPDDEADAHVVLPDSLVQAYETGVTAEINNIAMYEAFLQQDLPQDVQDVFTALRDASQNHLAAFERNLDRQQSTAAGGGYRGRQISQQ